MANHYRYKAAFIKHHIEDDTHVYQLMKEKCIALNDMKMTKDLQTTLDKYVASYENIQTLESHSISNNTAPIELCSAADSNNTRTAVS